MIKKEYKLELLTPLFMHGADAKGEIELRAASIKGLLRRWWRIKQNGNSLERENELFGSTEKKSTVRIYLKNVVLNNHLENEQLNFYRDNPGIKYLWYTGPVVHEGRKDVYRRLQKGSFTLVLEYKEENKADLENAMQRLIMLGGIGGKSKRGLGRLWSSENKYDKLQNVLENLRETGFRYYEFNSSLIQNPTAEKLLNIFGLIYLAFRVKMKHGDDGGSVVAGLIQKKYLAGYNRHIPDGSDRYPSKVIPLVFKDEKQYKGGFLIEDNNQNANAKEAIKSFEDYITNKDKIQEFARDIVSREKNNGNRSHLVDLYTSAKATIEQCEGVFNHIGGVK